VKTYACINAIATSKAVTAKTNKKGTKPKKDKTPIIADKASTKPESICNKVCPAIIFAKSRKLKLNVRIK
jgi:hypothetical protein